MPCQEQAEVKFDGKIIGVETMQENGSHGKGEPRKVGEREDFLGRTKGYGEDGGQ